MSENQSEKPTPPAGINNSHVMTRRGFLARTGVTALGTAIASRLNLFGSDTAQAASGPERDNDLVIPAFLKELINQPGFYTEEVEINGKKIIMFPTVDFHSSDDVPPDPDSDPIQIPVPDIESGTEPIMTDDPIDPEENQGGVQPPELSPKQPFSLPKPAFVPPEPKPPVFVSVYRTVNGFKTWDQIDSELKNSNYQGSMDHNNLEIGGYNAVFMKSSNSISKDKLENDFGHSLSQQALQDHGIQTVETSKIGLEFTPDVLAREPLIGDTWERQAHAGDPNVAQIGVTLLLIDDEKLLPTSPVPKYLQALYSSVMSVPPPKDTVLMGRFGFGCEYVPGTERKIKSPDGRDVTVGKVRKFDTYILACSGGMLYPRQNQTLPDLAQLTMLPESAAFDIDTLDKQGNSYMPESIPNLGEILRHELMHGRKFIENVVRKNDLFGDTGSGQNGELKTDVGTIKNQVAGTRDYLNSGKTSGVYIKLKTAEGTIYTNRQPDALL